MGFIVCKLKSSLIPNIKESFSNCYLWKSHSSLNALRILIKKILGYTTCIDYLYRTSKQCISFISHVRKIWLKKAYFYLNFGSGSCVASTLEWLIVWIDPKPTNTVMETVSVCEWDVVRFLVYEATWCQGDIGKPLCGINSKHL